MASLAISGIIGPLVTGFIVQFSGKYDYAFYSVLSLRFKPVGLRSICKSVISRSTKVKVRSLIPVKLKPAG